MRHLINMYIQADPATALGELANIPLTELIIETGIHDAIVRKLNAQGKLSNKSVAEAIINNVRKTIIRDQLTDPRFYEKMSLLLEDLIKQSRAETLEYKAFLREAEEVVRRLAEKDLGERAPALLRGMTEATVLYRNLDSWPTSHLVYPTPEEARAAPAVKLDRAIREHAPAGWKGDQTREAKVLNVLYPMLDSDEQATRALFDIVKNHPGY